MNDVLDFEIIGSVDEIEIPVEVDVVLGNRTQTVKFTAVWQRKEAEDAMEELNQLIEKNDQLVGAEVVRLQRSFIDDNLLRIKGFPTKNGKKINAGGDGDAYELSDVINKVCALPEYLGGLYVSGLGSLKGMNIEAARRKN